MSGCGEMKNAEHYEQVDIFNWSFSMRHKWPQLDLLYAVPNAGKRSPRQGAWMKAEGLRAGVPDIVLPIARHGYNSLYIELKAGKNKATKIQCAYMDKLILENNLAVVCVGADAAIRQIECYLGEM